MAIFSNDEQLTDSIISPIPLFQSSENQWFWGGKMSAITIPAAAALYDFNAVQMNQIDSLC